MIMDTKIDAYCQPAILDVFRFRDQCIVFHAFTYPAVLGPTRRPLIRNLRSMYALTGYAIHVDL